MNVRRSVCLIVPMLCAVVLAGGTASAQAGWFIEETPNEQAAKSSELAAVSCTPPYCEATGSYGILSGEEKPLAERGYSGPWLVQAIPAPERFNPAHLNGISCATTTFCETVGTYKYSGAQWDSLAEVWNGSYWTIQHSPNGTGTVTELARVSCTSATACESVGRHVTNGNKQPLAEGWNGTAWTLQNLESEQGGGLRGVSCTSATSCEAVGGTEAAFSFPLARYWNGTKWASQSIPRPAGAKFVQLNAVSCASASACEATGFYENSSSVDVPLAERWDGTTWKIQSTPTPEGAKLTTLEDVSCPTAESCRAAGHYQNSTGVDVTLVEMWNGTTWTIESTPNPVGTKGSLLHGISCWSATSCVSVGEYTNSSGVKVTLAEEAR